MRQGTYKHDVDGIRILMPLPPRAPVQSFSYWMEHSDYFLAVRTGFTLSVLTTWAEHGRVESIDELLRIIGELGPVCGGRWVEFCRLPGSAARQPASPPRRRRAVFGRFVAVLARIMSENCPTARRGLHGGQAWGLPGHPPGAGWRRSTVGLCFFGGTPSIERLETRG